MIFHPKPCHLSVHTYPRLAAARTVSPASAVNYPAAASVKQVAADVETTTERGFLIASTFIRPPSDEPSIIILPDVTNVDTTTRETATPQTTINIDATTKNTTNNLLKSNPTSAIDKTVNVDANNESVKPESATANTIITANNKVTVVAVTPATESIISSGTTVKSATEKIISSERTDNLPTDVNINRNTKPVLPNAADFSTMTTVKSVAVTPNNASDTLRFSPTSTWSYNLIESLKPTEEPLISNNNNVGFIGRTRQALLRLQDKIFNVFSL